MCYQAGVGIAAKLAALPAVSSKRWLNNSSVIVTEGMQCARQGMCIAPTSFEPIMQVQGLLAPRGRGGVLPTFAAAGLAGAVGTIALYPVRAHLGFYGFFGVEGCRPGLCVCAASPHGLNVHRP